MAYQIIMPAMEDFNPVRSLHPIRFFRKWIFGEDESGVGMVRTRTLIDFIRRSPLFACFHRFLVEEGQDVVPGQKIAEVYIDGVAVPIVNHGFGIVQSLVEMDDSTVLVPGDIIANIFERSDRSSRTKGFIPKPSTYQRWLRFGR